jgi:hypothetical protein
VLVKCMPKICSLKFHFIKTNLKRNRRRILDSFIIKMFCYHFLFFFFIYLIIFFSQMVSTNTYCYGTDRLNHWLSRIGLVSWNFSKFFIQCLTTSRRKDEFLTGKFSVYFSFFLDSLFLTLSLSVSFDKTKQI